MRKAGWRGAKEALAALWNLTAWAVIGVFALFGTILLLAGSALLRALPFILASAVVWWLFFR